MFLFILGGNIPIHTRTEYNNTCTSHRYQCKDSHECRVDRKAARSRDASNARQSLCREAEHEQRLGSSVWDVPHKNGKWEIWMIIRQ